MRLGVDDRKNGGTESKVVERQGIPVNPVSGDHRLALSHCMTIQQK